MPPIDSAPEGAEVLHQQQEPKFPEPQPGKESDEPVRGQPGGAQSDTDRSDSPEHAASVALNSQGADANPVVDEGHSFADGVTSLPRRR